MYEMNLQMNSRPLNISRLLVTVFGAGLLPVAPGTAGSLVAVGAYALGLWRLPLWGMGLVLLGTYLCGYLAIRRYERETGRHDDSRIVIDEVVGQWITLFATPPTPLHLGLAFFLFRLCDIVKPYPANRIDRLPGAAAVLLDDVVAGAWAALLLQLLLAVWR